MTDERTLDRLIAHLRGHVAELRRLGDEGAAPEEIAERRRLILRLQERLAYVVRDLLGAQRTSPVQQQGDPPPVSTAARRRPVRAHARELYY
jgi:hypothetical protein